MVKPKAERIQLIVDCQVLQAADRKRGMGFYLQSLLAGVVAQSKEGQLQWVFVINTRLAQLSAEDKALVKSFKGRMLEGEFLYQADGAVFNDAAAENRSRLDKLVAPLLTGDRFAHTVFFIPAMFSREIYPVFPTQGTANLMLFHDLIPYLYYRQYFHDPEGQPRLDYAQRFREVYKTDLFVTNSQTTADDLTVYFGVDPARILPIFGAAADRTGIKPTTPKFADTLKDGFVLMPSGDDFRKNNVLAAQAFAALNGPEKLVITSQFGAESQRQLRDVCPHVLFPGSVTDGELLWLFKHANAVYFPTLYEGLGMPLLEAVAAQAPIACSNIPVFAEISPSAFFFFNPDSVASMTEALRKVLQATPATTDAGIRKKREYPAILERFNWHKTARLFLEAVDRCHTAPRRPKLAIFCPSPASYSSVGKYAFEVHAELSQRYAIDYFIEEGQTEFEPVRPNILEYAANYYPAGTFDITQAARYDQILYHIGNSEFHVTTILNSLRLPANAIVHDTKLNGIFDYMKNYGFIPAERRDFEALLDEAFSCKYSSCLASIASHQKRLYCHSNYAKRAISEVTETDAAKVHSVPHPIGVPSIELRRAHKPTVSFAGIISEDKGIRLVAEVGKLGEMRVKVFGYGVLGDSPLLRGLEPEVEVIHDLTDKEFQDELRASAILINYRPNYHGETSRSALEAMRYGVVVIVKDVGWFGELPDDTVVKVNNEAEVLEAVRDLVEHPEKLLSIGRAARAYLREHFAYGRYAQTIKQSWEQGA